MESAPITATVSVAASDTTAKDSSAISLSRSRKSREIKIEIPECRNPVVTFTFYIYDADGVERYNVSGLAANSNPIILVERTLRTGYYFSILPSAAPQSAMTFTITVDCEA